MTQKWYAIANPIAGKNNYKQQHIKIHSYLKYFNIEYEFKITEYHKHEIEIVYDAIRKGYTHFISIGGDGTLHYIVNGVMKQNIISQNKIVIGVIPIGTGNDWIKTYNIDNDIKKSIEIIKKVNTEYQDIGFLELKNTSRYFNNVAGIGYDGYIVSNMDKLKNLGAISYLISSISAIISYKKNKYEKKVNKETIKEKCLMIIIGICKYSGGGMKLTSYSSSSNGLFDITIAKNLNILDLIKNLRGLYNGSIINHKKISTYKSTSLLIVPKNQNLSSFIEADGELVGSGSVKVSIYNKAIQFVVNKPFYG